MNSPTTSSGDPSLSAAGGYGPPGYGGPPPGGGYGPPGGGGGFGPPGGPPPGGGGFGPPPGPPPGGFGGPPGFAGGGPPPFNGGPPGYDGARMQAESMIKAPAITMMVFTIIGILLQLFVFLANVLGTGINAANGSPAGQVMSGAMGAVLNLVGILAGGFSIWAFLKMMKLQGRGLALAAVIMNMIPCTGSCCYINLFIGIWALVVLNNDIVKMGFQSTSGQQGFQG